MDPEHRIPRPPRGGDGRLGGDASRRRRVGEGGLPDGRSRDCERRLERRGIRWRCRRARPASARNGGHPQPRSGIRHGRQAREQALLQRLVAGLEGTPPGSFRAAPAGSGTGRAEGGPGEPLQVGAVEDVRLAAEAAGHPLPAEAVAGAIGIEEVGMEPAGAHLPAQPPPVHPVAGQPEPGVVMQPAAAHQIGHEGIDAGQAGAAPGQILRQRVGVGLGGMAGLEGFAVVVNSLAPHAPEPLPIVAPGELPDQRLTRVAGCAMPRATESGSIRRTRAAAATVHGSGGQRCSGVRQPRNRFRLGRPGQGRHPGKRRLPHLRQAQHAMADEGRQPRDGPIDMVTARAVGERVDRREQALGLTPAPQTRTGGSPKRAKPGRQQRGNPLALREPAGQIGGVNRPRQAQGGHRGTAATRRPAGSG